METNPTSLVEASTQYHECEEDRDTVASQLRSSTARVGELETTLAQRNTELGAAQADADSAAAAEVQLRHRFNRIVFVYEQLQVCSCTFAIPIAS